MQINYTTIASDVEMDKAPIEEYGQDVLKLEGRHYIDPPDLVKKYTEVVPALEYFGLRISLKTRKSRLRTEM